jgi:hypothetical protein
LGADGVRIGADFAPFFASFSPGFAASCGQYSRTSTHDPRESAAPIRVDPR